MQETISSVPFSGTKEQEAELKAKLAEIKGTQGATMPALQAAQAIYGYLPIEVQKIVADELGEPLEKVFGVATFYAQFTLNPRGKYQVSVCLGTACYVKGAGELMSALEKDLGLKSEGCSADGKFSLHATRCIGCCGLAPVMTINDNVYGKLQPADVNGILAQYK